MINEVLEGYAQANDGDNSRVEKLVGDRVLELCARFPIYQGR